jgi:hypothetical protein
MSSLIITISHLDLIFFLYRLLESSINYGLSVLHVSSAKTHIAKAALVVCASYEITWLLCDSFLRNLQTALSNGTVMDQAQSSFAETSWTEHYQLWRLKKITAKHASQISGNNYAVLGDSCAFDTHFSFVFLNWYCCEFTDIGLS